MTGFTKRWFVGWGDLDANGHMANTAFLSKCADIRMFYFSEHGFPWKEFVRARVGPVIQRDSLEYRRELRLHDPFDVTFAIEGLSPDGARWIIVNEFLREDGQLSARVASHGGWLDLGARALAAPPPELDRILRDAPRTSAFAELPGLRKTPAG